MHHGALLGIPVIVFLCRFVTMELARTAVYCANQMRFILCGSICQEVTISEWENTFISQS